MLESKYDSAIAEVMANCANDRQIQNALVDQASDCITTLQDCALAHVRQFSAFSEEGEDDQRQTAKLVADDLFRFGPIAELLWDPEVTEIMVNTPDSVWIERQGRIAPTGVKFRDEEHVLRTIERIVSPDGCRCDNRDSQIICTLNRDGAPFDGAHVSAMANDWVLNIRKRGNDNDIDTPFQNFDYDSWVKTLGENLANYYRSELFARMGISDGYPDKELMA